MIDRKRLDDLTQRLSDNLPSPLTNLSDGLKNQIQNVLKNELRRLDLVTREEFEAQRTVLLRTRDKLEQMERLVRALENQLANRS